VFLTFLKEKVYNKTSQGIRDTVHEHPIATTAVVVSGIGSSPPTIINLIIALIVD
jgi:hypothetical protein